VDFAGNISGQLSVIDIDELRILHETQAHAGGIQAVAAHPQLPYVAALATDRSVSVWSYDEEGSLRRVCSIPLRNIKPVNDEDEVPYVQSTSQALGFHDSRRRIVTRSGNAGLVELEFTKDGSYSIVNCARIHRDADLISVRFAKNSDLVLSGSIDGEFVLSERGQLIRRWDVGHNVHWAEHLSDTTYLLASDRRCVARAWPSSRRSSAAR
jgi:WD40 repeat protein